MRYTVFRYESMYFIKLILLHFFADVSLVFF